MDYTKGEWQVDDTTVYALNKWGVNRFYAGVQRGNVDSGASTSKEELIADAQLISAAPDMYEALKELQEHMLVNVIVEDNTIRAKLQTARQRVAEAIAKAEGKT